MPSTTGPPISALSTLASSSTAWRCWGLNMGHSAFKACALLLNEFSPFPKWVHDLLKKNKNRKAPHLHLLPDHMSLAAAGRYNQVCCLIPCISNPNYPSNPTLATMDIINITHLSPLPPQKKPVLPSLAHLTPPQVYVLWIWTLHHSCK